MGGLWGRRANQFLCIWKGMDLVHTCRCLVDGWSASDLDGTSHKCLCTHRLDLLLALRLRADVLLLVRLLVLIRLPWVGMCRAGWASVEGVAKFCQMVEWMDVVPSMLDEWGVVGCSGGVGEICVCVGMLVMGFKP